MLALDTDVVVRYLTDDHPLQSAKARNLVDKHQVFVATTVILETEWVLRSTYRLRAQEIARALAAFAGLPTVTLEDTDAVIAALANAEQGIDFADALHLEKSRGCESFATFDKKLVNSSALAESIPVRLL